MGLEAASYISQLNAANPVGGVDNYSTADDHIRLMKAVLFTQFPNLGAAPVTATAASLSSVTGPAEMLSNKNAVNGYAGLGASAQLGNAQVSAGNITQHQGSLAIAGSQLTGTVPDARLSSNVPLKDVTNTFAIGQVIAHATNPYISLSRAGAASYLEAIASQTRVFAPTGFSCALVSDAGAHNLTLSTAGVATLDGTTMLTNLSALNASNIGSGSIPAANVPVGAVTQHQAALAIACSQLTGNMPNARIVVGNVTQHQDSITSISASATIGGNQIGTVDVPVVIGSWVRGKCRSEVSGGATLNTSDMAAGYTFSFYNDSASNQTITQGAGVTLRTNGTSLTGNKTIAQRTLCTIWCRTGTEAIVTGAG